ncbi:MAG: hypothetical protein DMD33_09965 [Gemmatimonadetes bacterium]|nr:MAG: hypothetical protein DMD33_09965 [Gemmatimonadota bacterium]
MLKRLLRRDLWTAGRVLAGLALLLLLLVLWRVSAVRGARETVVHSDFGAFWLQGYYFLTGRPLFDLPPHVRGPAYPPFAAMVFQLFALLPLPTSAAILYFVNLLLVPVAAYLTKGIVDKLHPERNRAAWPLVVAVILSLQFFLNNMNLIQLNEVILVLCLLGIKAYLDGNDGWAALAFVSAAAIKVVPAVFVGWLILRGRRRAALAVIPAAAACLALPVVFRGVDAGVRDLAQYQTKVLSQFERGHVISSSTNQNLGALVYRLTVPAPDDINRDYRPLFPTSERTAAAIYRTAFAVVLLAFVGNLVALRLRHAPLTAFELGSVFLAGHLLSGITWKAHLVTLLFTFYCFLSIRVRELGRRLRVFVYVLVAMMFVVGLTGRDLVGRVVQHRIDGYSVIVWTEILLFVGCLVFSQRVTREREVASGAVP